MGEEHGLRPLKVRVAGHYGINVLFGDFKNGFLKFLYKKKDRRNFVLQIKPLVKSDLVVTRPSGVEFTSELSDFFDKTFFNRHVYVFHVRGKNELARRNLFFDRAG